MPHCRYRTRKQALASNPQNAGPDLTRSLPVHHPSVAATPRNTTGGRPTVVDKNHHTICSPTVFFTVIFGDSFWRGAFLVVTAAAPCNATEMFPRGTWYEYTELGRPGTAAVQRVDPGPMYLAVKPATVYVVGCFVVKLLCGSMWPFVGTILLRPDSG